MESVVKGNTSLLALVLTVPGQSGGGAGGRSSGDGALPEPAFNHGEAAVQEGDPAEPAHQHPRGAVPGLQRKSPPGVQHRCVSWNQDVL